VVVASRPAAADPLPRITLNPAISASSSAFTLGFSIAFNTFAGTPFKQGFGQLGRSLARHAEVPVERYEPVTVLVLVDLILH